MEAAAEAAAEAARRADYAGQAAQAAEAARHQEELKPINEQLQRAEEQQAAARRRAELEEQLRKQEAALVAAKQREEEERRRRAEEAAAAERRRAEAAAAEKRRRRAEAVAKAERDGNQLHVAMFKVADELGGLLANLRPDDGSAPRYEARDLVFGLPQHAARTRGEQRPAHRQKWRLRLVFWPRKAQLDCTQARGVEHYMGVTQQRPTRSETALRSPRCGLAPGPEAQSSADSQTLGHVALWIGLWAMPCGDPGWPRG